MVVHHLSTEVIPESDHTFQRLDDAGAATDIASCAIEMREADAFASARLAACCFA